MHYVNSKTLLSSKNGMNLYRGCTHGCIYCDSRSKIYNMNHKFEDVEVNENYHELLKKELIKRPKAMIGTGAMTDPYIPVEKRLKHVRKSLELIHRYGFGFTCITKSDLILRDLDLLKKINENSKAVVQMTLTTADDDLCKVLEPNVCPTSRRVEVLKTLNEEGIREGNREYFYEKLDEHFPGLKDKYINKFGNNYGLPSVNNKKLMAIFKKRTSENGILNDNDEIFRYLFEFPEKSVQTKLI